MIAIVNASEGYTCMLPLVDRPFLQHVIEVLVARGASHIHVMVGDHAHQVETFLGDGRRWGVGFTFHLTRDKARPFGVLAVLAAEIEEPWTMLAEATTLPCIELPGQHGSLRWDNENGLWSGWALLHRQDLWMAALASDAENSILTCTQAMQDSVTLSIRRDEDYLAAQYTVLCDRRPDLLRTGRQIRPGVWIGRGVRMHPHARLFAPVHVGDYCKIDADAQVGPGTVVGSGSMVDAAATVRGSMVMSNTYVWPRTNVENAILWPYRARIVDLHGTAGTRVPPDAGHGTATEPTAAVRQRTAPALVALGLSLLLFPLMLIITGFLRLFRAGPVWHARDVVLGPVDDPAQHWPTFRLLSLAPGPPRSWMESLLFHKLPGLLHVGLGQLDWVGTMPRTVSEVRNLPEGWRDLCLSTRPGLFQTARIDASAADNLYAAEVCSTVPRRRAIRR